MGQNSRSNRGRKRKGKEEIQERIQLLLVYLKNKTLFPRNSLWEKCLERFYGTPLERFYGISNTESTVPALQNHLQSKNLFFPLAEDQIRKEFLQKGLFLVVVLLLAVITS